MTLARGVPQHERGYAMVAVVGGIAVMAAIAAAMVQYTTSRLDIIAAEATQARLTAAADAGIAIALDGLLRPARGNPWPIDGQVRRASFAGIPLTLRVEDENGKVMLNRLDENNAQWLVESLGLSGEQMEIARDSLSDWVDDDSETHDQGAESEFYTPLGKQPRNGWMLSIDELAEVRGFTPAMVDRIRAIATVDSSTAPFDPHTATPLAIKIMTDGRDDSVEMIDRRREMAGQRVALEFSNPNRLKNRALTIIASASDDAGGQATRRALVVITGSPRRPYELRWSQ